MQFDFTCTFITVTFDAYIPSPFELTQITGTLNLSEREEESSEYDKDDIFMKRLEEGFEKTLHDYNL